MRTQVQMNAIWVLAFADAGYECNEGPAHRVMMGEATPRDLESVYEEMQRVRAYVFVHDINLNFEKYYETSS